MLREGLILLSRSDAAKALVTGTPLRRMAQRFVAGETVDEVVAAMRAANEDGLGAIGNFLGESVHDERSARAAGDVYSRLLDRIAEEGLDAYASLKFTALGQDISAAFLEENLGRILEKARAHGIFLRFDMESSEYTQQTLDEFEKLWTEGWRDIGVVLQSYLKRSAGDVARMNQLGARVRLCKGAYAEPPEVAFQRREDVDASFVELMRMLVSEGTDPAIATHDERMIEATVDFHAREGIARDAFEFQMLYGVRRDLQRQLRDDGYRMRVYVPFGTHWYPYLMRRLAERPANVLFFAGSVVRESPLGALWPDGHGSGEGRPGHNGR